jgi:hypothetical protein
LGFGIWFARRNLNPGLAADWADDADGKDLEPIEFGTEANEGTKARTTSHATLVGLFVSLEWPTVSSPDLKCKNAFRLLLRGFPLPGRGPGFLRRCRPSRGPPPRLLFAELQKPQKDPAQIPRWQGRSSMSTGHRARSEVARASRPCREVRIPTTPRARRPCHAIRGVPPISATAAAALRHFDSAGSFVACQVTTCHWPLRWRKVPLLRNVARVPSGYFATSRKVRAAVSP